MYKKKERHLTTLPLLTAVATIQCSEDKNVQGAVLKSVKNKI